jgi:hypothetical protein
MKSFAEISNKTFLSIQMNITHLIAEKFTSIKSWSKFNFKDFFDDLFFQFKGMFEKLFPSYSNKLWKYTFNTFTLYYVQFVLVQATKMKKEALPEYLVRVEEETESIKEFYSSVCSTKEQQDHQAKFQALKSVFMLPPEEMIIKFIELKVFLGKWLDVNLLVAFCKRRMES